MKTPSVATRNKPAPRTREHYVENGIMPATEDEPPGKSDIIINTEEEPPGNTATGDFIALKNVPSAAWNDWKWHFRNRITTISQLSQFIPLSAKEQAQLRLVTRRYPLSITPYYLSLINPYDPADPIRAQAVPSIMEMTMSTIGLEDPLTEEEDSVVPGLVHRYPDRALMVLTDICPMLCRHCTRKREWRHGGWVRNDAEIDTMLNYLRQNKAIRDVIVSGGDPLTLSTRRLGDILSRIREIGHIEIIRIGTRFPVVLPQRIDAELCDMLSKYGPIWLNTHFNHPREITAESAEACDRLLRSGVPVNNQSVLLRGVNDTVETQLKLCQGLLRIKVRPYYLFQCDEVQGTEHLRTTVETGIKIIEGMRGHTSGLAVPTFVVDLSHGGGKVPLQPNYVLSQSEEELLLKNYEGQIYRYRNPAHHRTEANAELASVATAEGLLSRTETQHTPEGRRDADKGLSYDLKEAALAEGAGDDSLEEYDCPETVEIISAALEAKGHTVVLLGGGSEFLDNIRREKVDFVFNIAEGRGKYRSRESQVPSILEMLDIPYTGSDPQCLAVCLDKPLTKKFAAAEGIATPRWLEIADSEALCQTSWQGFPFPAIVKPAHEGSSKGVHATSLAFSAEQAQEEAYRMLCGYQQPAMVEEFIAGDEVTVGIIGNSSPKVLGMMRILPRKNDGHFIYSVEVKRDYLNLVDYECPARLGEEILNKLESYSLKAFKSLGCRDFARVDFRVGPGGIPYFLEINPLPGLGTYSDLVIMAVKLGWTHEALIAAVLDAALERYPQCVRV